MRLPRLYSKYARQYASLYRTFGEAMAQGSLATEFAVRRRIAFAILSANAPWQASVDALRLAEDYQFDIPDSAMEAFQGFQMVPAKADYLRKLPQGDAIYALTKQPSETWVAYRERLAKQVSGLGRCKASFAALLLYPTESPLACLDTWMVKTYVGGDKFLQLPRKVYEAIERKVQRFGKAYGLNGALAQWLIWDASRGGEPNAHDIFPGGHKDAEVIPF